MENSDKLLLQTVIREKLIAFDQVKAVITLNEGGISVADALLQLSLLNQKQIDTIRKQLYRDSKTLADETLGSSGQRNINKKSFGRYEVIKEIGEGSMGKVFLANDTKLERHVALKTLFNRDEINLARFQREAKTLAKLSHPNIVQIFDIDEHEGEFFIVMEYLTGRSLLEVLKYEKLSLKRTLKIVRKLAQTLQYIHQNNVLHRDLKPANIMMDKEKVTLTDFGLARQQKATTLSSRKLISGSLGYMSPEQAMGDNDQLDGRSDIFSLGVIFYEMLTGKRAFYKTEKVEALLQIIEYHPPKPRETNSFISEEIEKICLKAIEKDKEKRYQSAQEMLVDINIHISNCTTETLIAI